MLFKKLFCILQKIPYLSLNLLVIGTKEHPWLSKTFLGRLMKIPDRLIMAEGLPISIPSRSHPLYCIQHGLPSIPGIHSFFICSQTFNIQFIAFNSIHWLIPVNTRHSFILHMQLDITIYSLSFNSIHLFIFHAARHSIYSLQHSIPFIGSYPSIPGIHSFFICNQTSQYMHSLQHSSLFIYHNHSVTFIYSY